MLMFNKIIKDFKWGHHNVRLETGEIARQANASVLVNMEDTVVLITIVSLKQNNQNQNFLPLSVEYIEKSYAAGKIPGGFFRREGRLSENEILISRLIDRSLRPLFPEKFNHDIQILAHVISINPEIPSDIPAIIGASAALAISGLPINGLIAATRVGFIDNKYILNPTRSQIKLSTLDLIVTGTEQAIIMVESESNQLSEEIILNSIIFGHTNMQNVINEIYEFSCNNQRPEILWESPIADTILVNKITKLAISDLEQAYEIQEKIIRIKKIKEIYESIILTINEEKINKKNEEIDDSMINNIISSLEAKIIRNKIINGEPRIDGRHTRGIRPINIRTSLLPRAHGSALFTRGETQSLVTATLGTKSDEQIIDALEGEYRDKFIFHYNMPPFATGEIGRISSPKRREIGHGRLAKKALMACMPNSDEFNYSIRIVSEITESNGSSSMAAVCGGCLALMDAGVPIKDHVAGIAMGLIIEGNKFAILTDILGDEDKFGDMDFKVAGTTKGITALQMDIKIQGITKEIICAALMQAKEGRMIILEKMKNAINASNIELSTFAPRVVTIKINPEKIRDVIGKGGSVIRSITEKTNTSIDIEDNGIITIASANNDSIIAAKQCIENITATIESGKTYIGTIIKLLDFGAIINLLPGKDGLLHISEIANERIKNINDYLKEGQTIKVKVIHTDEKGRIRLSIKSIINNAPNNTSQKNKS